MMRLASLLAVVLLPLAASAHAEAPRFGLPVACAIGTDCAIQNYVDTDPGPEWRDHACGAMSYDGHDGTDFRIADADMLRAGIPVLAAAGGTVLRARDGVRDAPFVPGQSQIPSERACGNGMVIDHGAGWRTQYCHLRQGSIAVEPGDTVKAGALLGAVGQSGWAQFPHVHFAVTFNGKPVDPFTASPDGFAQDSAPAIAACGTSGPGLWRADAARWLAYRAPLVLNTGFAAGPIDMADIDTRAQTIAQIAPDTPALVFYGRSIGVSKGDRQRVTITTPDGGTLVDTTTDPEPRPRAQVMAFSGKTRPPQGWQPGTYTARYEIIRDGRVVAERLGRITLIGE